MLPKNFLNSWKSVLAWFNLPFLQSFMYCCGCCSLYTFQLNFFYAVTKLLLHKVIIFLIISLSKYAKATLISHRKLRVSLVILLCNMFLQEEVLWKYHFKFFFLLCLIHYFILHLIFITTSYVIFQNYFFALPSVTSHLPSPLTHLV